MQILAVKLEKKGTLENKAYIRGRIILRFIFQTQDVRVSV